jgi:hypothetical protein
MDWCVALGYSTTFVALKDGLKKLGQEEVNSDTERAAEKERIPSRTMI